MSIGPNEWRRQRQAAREGGPRPSIVACDVRPRPDAPGYTVTIRGSDLVGPGVPIEARVGDVPLRDVEVSRDGVITGTLLEPPRELQVVVGAGRGEATAVARLHDRPEEQGR
jgi:hypothetical protein